MKKNISLLITLTLLVGCDIPTGANNTPIQKSSINLSNFEIALNIIIYLAHPQA